MNCALHELTTGSLKALRDSLSDGAMSYGLSRSEVRRFGGAGTELVMDYLQSLVDDGFGPKQISRLIEAILTGRESTFPLSHILDLVISGPEVQGIPMGDTAASMHALVSTATESVVVVGYAIYNGRIIFKQLSARMDAYAELDVKFLLNVPRNPTNTSEASLISLKFAHDFRKKEWPGKRLPDIYYDRRSLEMESSKRASLHAKCVIVDRREALITSANFTDAARDRNIEVGLCLRQPETVNRLALYFDTLIAKNVLTKIPAER
jgi:phosphatidylserine/phosphatidylglycerophosphate/cardiolipin synthase-like enzyme